MSTVAFFRGEIPRELALRDCSLPMAYAPKNAFSALYGENGKQNGFMAAREYAARQGLQYTVIDFVVELEAQNALVMKPEDLPMYDFLNFGRMSVALRQEVSLWFAESVAGGVLPTLPSDTDLAGLSAQAAIQSWPALVDAVIQHKDGRHLKVIAYQAMTSMGTRPLAIGSIPLSHWGAIRSATCRLNPSVRVALAS